MYRKLCFIALAAVSAAGLVSCSGGEDSSRAADWARQACQKLTTRPQGSPPRAGTKHEVYVLIAQQIHEVSDLSARAARGDSRWKELNGAMSVMVDAADWKANLPDPDHLTPAENLTFQQWQDRVRTASTSALTQCRKATARPQ